MRETKPSSSTVENDAVRKMIWALSHSSGKTTEVFAKSTPVFDLEWLNAFSKKEYSPDELVLFDINNSRSQNYNKNYTFLKKPYSDNHEPPLMSIVNNSIIPRCDDKILNWIIYWMVRHLNNPSLILWVSKNGGILCGEFKKQVIEKLNDISLLKNKDEFEKKIFK